MAGYQSVHGVMHALETLLNVRMPAALSANRVDARAVVVGSKDLLTAPAGNRLALYLHRLTVDPTIPGGWVRAGATLPARREPEVSLRLHFLMIAFGETARAEIDLMAWGLQQLLAIGQLDIDQLNDPAFAWREAEVVQLATEEMATEDLLRIWDALKIEYHLTVPCVARAVRVRADAPREEWPAVTSRILVAGDEEAAR
ncbi:DUF4255 domain-containing protein [Paracraurococcus ruber]|nr:DUF4255 domain-containing protein [Paracraurococcus ruber]